MKKFFPLLRILSIVTGLIVGLLLMGTFLFFYLLRDPHFKETIKQRIEMSLSEGNFEVHIGDLAYHPFRGLMAENVVIQSTQENKRLIAQFKRLAFSLNIFGIFPGHSFVKKVHLHNASVNIPLPNDPNHFLPLWIAHGKVILKPNLLEIFDTKLTFENIQFSVRGSLVNLEALQSPANASEEDSSQKLNLLIEELRKVKYLKKLPQVDVIFEGDLSAPEIFHVFNISINAQDFEYQDIYIQQLVLYGAYVQRHLEIQQFQIHVPQGEFTAWASADLNTSKGHLTLHSTLNPIPFLPHFISPQKIQTLQNLHISSPPEIHIDTDFSWENKELRYDGTGYAALHSFSYKNLSFSLLELRLSSKNQIVKVEQLSLQDAKGKLTASGSTDLNTQTGHYTVDSSLNLIPIFKEFVSDSKNEYLEHLQTQSTPQIHLTTDLFWGNKKLEYHGAGSVALSSFSYNNQFFSQLNAKFSAADGVIELQELGLTDPQGEQLTASGKLVNENDQSILQNFHIQTPSGIIQANGFLATEKFQIHIDSTVNPKEFTAFFPPKIRQFFDEMEIRDAPHFTLHLNGSPSNWDALSGYGHIHLGRTAVRKAWIDSAGTQFEINNQALICRDFSVGHNDQHASGTLIYDHKQKAVRLHNLVSTLFPEEIMRWIDPHLARILSYYKFATPPHVKAEGVVHLKNQDLNDLSLQIHSNGLDYDLLKRTLHFDQIAGTIQIQGPWVKVHIPSANIFQGSVGFSADVSINPKNPILKVDLTFSRLDFARLTQLYFNYDKSKGLLSGNLGFQARIGQEADMVGNGNVRIEDGTVLSVPFLGPISFILNKIVPGSGNAAAKDAVASFKVGDRKVTTNNLQIAGSRFTLLGYGDIEFLTGKMDMTMRIHAQGLPGVLFFPISRLLEYESKGTIMNPEWRLK